MQIFGLHWDGPILFRRRYATEWALCGMAQRRARELRWDGKKPLRLHDSDGYLLGGFVPNRSAG